MKLTGCPLFIFHLRVVIGGMMKGDELADRLLDFAAQVVKAGTSVGAHYEEARGAESKADFAHKLGIALKECRETRY